MDKIRETLLKERPNLSPNTLKTYMSLLSSLHKKIYGADDPTLENFKNVKKVMEALKDKAGSSRKTTLSALFVLTGVADYRDQMQQDIKEYKADVSKQEMNEKQKEAFISQEDIANKLLQLKMEADHIYKKQDKTAKDINELQNYILLVLTSGYYFPPRRALDWVAMKVKNIGENDNLMQKGKFVFHTFKGSNKKGEQVIDIPKPVQAILKKWLTVNKTDYLLFDTEGKPLNASKINQRLNKILKSGSAINALRHSYLSSKYQDTIKANEEMKKDFEAMGSNKDNQEKVYIQKI